MTSKFFRRISVLLSAIILATTCNIGIISSSETVSGAPSSKVFDLKNTNSVYDGPFDYNYNFNFSDKSLYNEPVTVGSNTREYPKVFANSDGTGTDTSNGEVYFSNDGSSVGAIKFDTYNKKIEMKSSETLEVKPYTDYTVYLRMRSQNNGITFKILNPSDESNIISPIVASDSNKYFRSVTFNTGANTKIKVQFVVNNSRGFVYFLSIKETLDYIRNGDFESGTLQDYSYDVVGKGAVVNKETDADGVHSGNYSLKMTGYSDFTNNLQVKPNTDYIVYGWVKTTGANAYLRVRSLKNDTKALGSGTIKVLDNTVVRDKSWQRVYGEFNTGDNEKLLLWLAVDDGGTAYFDDLVLQPKSSVIDSDFESDIYPWKQIVDENANRKPPVLSREKAKTGTQSMLLDGTSAETSVEYLMSVEKNKTYFLNLYTFAENAGGKVSVTGIDDITYQNATVREYKTINDWVNTFISFNSGSNDVMRIKITQNSGGKAYIDAIKCSTDSQGIVIPDSKITSLDSKLWALKEGGENLISNGDFEAEPAAGESWNQNTFLTDGVTVSLNSAYQGASGLHVELKSATETQERIMWVNVEKDTDYVFSSYVKGAYISDDNRADLNFGLIEQLTYTYLNDGTEICTLAPTCWDNQWHIIGCEFNSGNQEKIGIKISAKNSIADFDNMVLCTADDAEVVRMPFARAKTTIEITENISQNNSCLDDNNLIKDYNFEDVDHSFWQEINGYGDIIKIKKSHDLAGNILVMENEGIASWQKAIKWIDVIPNTEYTLSLLVRSDAEGENSFGIIDKDYNTILDVEQGEAEGLWKNVCFSFATGNNDTIGFYFGDGAGKVAFKDIRLFEKANGFKAEVPDYALPDDTENKEENNSSEDVPQKNDNINEEVYNEDEDIYFEESSDDESELEETHEEEDDSEKQKTPSRKKKKRIVGYEYDFTFLWIVLPIVVVVLTAGVITFIIIKKKRRKTK